MKPKELQNPGRLVITDRLFHVPEESEELQPFTFPGWHHPDIFGDSKPVRIEYCCGNGLWIASRAEMDPTSNWVGIERRFMRVRKVWSKIKNRHLSNLFVVSGEAHATTQTYFPDKSVSEVFINFPDPWPKRRHAKYRLIQPAFVKEIVRILHPGAFLTIVTDDVSYSKQIIRIMVNEPFLRSVFAPPYYETEYPGYGTSYFEDLWREQGKEILYHKFQKL